MAERSDLSKRSALSVGAEINKMDDPLNLMRVMPPKGMPAVLFQQHGFIFYR
jgi:hypothetical protein